MSKFQKIGPGMFLVPKEGGMRVSGLLVATEKLLGEIEMEHALEQVRNVAHLPGILGYSVAMPDMHWGYGFPIGGVAAMDATHGVISPGGVGYDINCGVRLAMVPLMWDELKEKEKADLIRKIFQTVPSGVGHGQRGKRGISDRDYSELLIQGAKWSVNQGLGFARDLEHTESNGKIEGADPSTVSQTAKDRGKDQLGTIGSGNHFCEIGKVDTIYLPDVAEKWGVKLGQVYILIHSGSRGFGHQVCQDTLNLFVKKGFDKNLPDRQLVAAPIQSIEGKNYFAAMASAANYAFNNRQQILHEVRTAFHEVLSIPMEEIRLVYDVCHNIAKFEEHEIDGQMRKVCVHRKGATRAFKNQPVLVPGDMARASHLLVGLANPMTFCSCCHGAGRAKSRVQSAKTWKGQNLEEYMKSQGVIVMASSYNTIAEEMPDAYKNVDEVVEAVQEAKLANMVARLRPHLVLKG